MSFWDAHSNGTGAVSELFGFVGKTNVFRDRDLARFDASVGDTDAS